MHRNAASPSLWKWSAPSGLLGCKGEHTEMAGVLCQEALSEFKGIFFSGIGKLIKKTFYDEGGMGMTDRAPPEHRHAARARDLGFPLMVRPSYVLGGQGMARWVKTRTDRSDAVHMERVLNFTEQGGMNEVLANLYSVTGKAEYLATAGYF